MVVTSCPGCGSSVPPARGPGRPRKWCSERCRVRTFAVRNPEYAERQRASGAARSAAITKAERDRPRTCTGCGSTFTRADGGLVKYCSVPCRSRALLTSRTKTCAVDSCCRPLKAQGMCPLHYKAWRRSEFGREKTAPQEWTDARRDAYHRRRALKLATAVDGPVIRDDIAERDEYRCGLCGEPVDMGVAYPDTQSPSLDHILPLSRGGAHVPENVQLAHLGCNVAKGARVAVAA